MCVLVAQSCLTLCNPMRVSKLQISHLIKCYSTIIKYVVEYDRKPCLDDESFFEMLKNTVDTGVHTKKPMGLAYFHTPKELKGEIENAGFVDVDLRGVIGPCWLIRNLDEAWNEPVKKEAIMKVVRLLEKEESIIGLSTHFLSVSRKEQ